MIVEPIAGDRPADNLNPVGRMYYNASTMICVPTSLSQEVGAALGAQAGEARLREVMGAGGFGNIRRRLLGERGFDFANIFTNPDLADRTRPVATLPGRFARRVAVVADAAGLERGRLLRWVLAWTGLSAAWFLGDGASPAIDLCIAELAAAELDR